MSRLQVINSPIYFKNAKEAFVFANPHLGRILLPEKYAAAEKITPQKLLAEVSALLEKSKTTASTADNKQIVLCKELSEKLANYIKKGAIGNILLKQALKKDGSKLMEQLKSAGIEI